MTLFSAGTRYGVSIVNLVSHPDCRTITEEQYESRMILQHAMVCSGFQPISCEWRHFMLKNEPYPDTYFEFPVSSAYLRR